MKEKFSSSRFIIYLHLIFKFKKGEGHWSGNYSYGVTEDDVAGGERTGGFGSTSK